MGQSVCGTNQQTLFLGASFWISSGNMYGASCLYHLNPLKNTSKRESETNANFKNILENQFWKPSRHEDWRQKETHLCCCLAEKYPWIQIYSQTRKYDLF